MKNCWRRAIVLWRGIPGRGSLCCTLGISRRDMQNVSGNLDRYPNMFVDMAARIGELGRQPRTARKFFDKYQDRILFGTDATPHGDDYPQQVFNDKLYEIYFRFLETDDEYFDYAPAKVPPQGRWKIYGIEFAGVYLEQGVLRERRAGSANLDVSSSHCSFGARKVGKQGVSIADQNSLGQGFVGPGCGGAGRDFDSTSHTPEGSRSNYCGHRSFSVRVS